LFAFKAEGRDQSHQHLQCSGSRDSRVRPLNLAVVADDEARFESFYAAVGIDFVLVDPFGLQSEDARWRSEDDNPGPILLVSFILLDFGEDLVVTADVVVRLLRYSQLRRSPRSSG
jgi:hypothetical protein